MIQTWKYYDESYIVDTERPESYHDLVRSLLDFNDCYDELVEYMEDEVGNGADVLIRMIWEGPEHVADSLVHGFVEWLMDDMGRLTELVETNCILTEGGE